MVRTGYCIMVHSPRDGPQQVADILLKGPEPLASQFESGYGMALNLLFSRSLAQAHDFVARSFSSYMSVLRLMSRLVTVELE